MLFCPIFILFVFVIIFVGRSCSHQRRTSNKRSKTSSDEDEGARVRSNRSAKENSLRGVCFGCFLYIKIEYIIAGNLLLPIS